MIEEGIAEKLHCILYDSVKLAGLNDSDFTAFLMAEMVGLMVMGDMTEKGFDSICDEMKEQLEVYKKKKRYIDGRLA